MAYALLWLFSVIRFDIGADYENHARIFVEKGNIFNHGVFTLLDLFKPEPLIYVFIFVFKDLPFSYVYVFAAISFVTLFMIYKTFDYYKIHVLGVFLFIATFSYFQTWDWSRQGLALAFFLYSMRYVESKEPWKYFLFIFLAICSHYSAALLLPMYWVARSVPQREIIPYVLFGVLFVCLLIGIAGFFENIHNRIVSLIPFYGQIYANTQYTQNGEGSYHSTVYILTMLLYAGAVWMSRKEHVSLSLLLTIGGVIYAIGGGNLNFMRASWFFTGIQMILIPRILQNCSIREYNKNFTRYIYMVLLYVAILEGVYIKVGFRGVVPYETIFSKEFSQQTFRLKEY